ncbi:MAG: CbbQ/NirQ/NorQ C-terminal domain-containing protein [Candidatus Micrarchaeota archaeon]|nr:CbbQ/NirQ/NorQ C-terminal domain-containing protein [Candidatus Micrarchaeota archaeon]
MSETCKCGGTIIRKVYADGRNIAYDTAINPDTGSAFPYRRHKCTAPMNPATDIPGTDGMATMPTVLTGLADPAWQESLTTRAQWQSGATSGHGRIPAVDPAYRVNTLHARAINETLRRLDATGEPVNIGLHGPAGSGKTTLVAQIAAHRGTPLYVLEMAAIQTADECYGTQTLERSDDGGTRLVFCESELVRGVETPGAVVLINDLALLQSSRAQNGLNELLDPSTRRTYLASADREIAVAPGVIIAATWNVGSEYTGASIISEQLLDRFRSGLLLYVDHPPLTTLTALIQARAGCSDAIADRLANVATWLRHDDDPINVSTRALPSAAQLIAAGMPLGEAIRVTLLGDLSTEDATRAFGIINVNVGRVYPKDDPSLWIAPVEPGAMVPFRLDSLGMKR